MHSRGFHHWCDFGAAMFNQAGFRRSATHIKGQGIGQASCPRKKYRSQGATCRAGFQKANRECTCYLGRTKPTIGLHQPQGADEAEPFHFAQQAPQIPIHQWLHKGIGAGCDAAFIFSDFGCDFARKAYRYVWECFAQDRCCGLLMRRIGIGMQEADRNGIAAFGDQARTSSADLGHIQIADDFPEGKVLFAMHGQGKNTGIFSKDTGCAIALVDIQIDHHDLESLF